MSCNFTSKKHVLSESDYLDSWSVGKPSVVIDQTSQVIVDYLSFTFSKFWLPDLKDFSEHKVTDKYISAFGSGLSSDLSSLLVSFVENFLGLKISVPRGRGLNGYNDSCSLSTIGDPDSDGVIRGIQNCGFVGFGGNNDTIYLTISGVGCKSVFSNIYYADLHHVLSNMLQVKVLNRLDIAFDDFDNNFNADYAFLAYKDNAFRNSKGGRMPALTRIQTFNSLGDKDGETLYIGSRSSTVFWRVYDKAKQLKIDDSHWRSEVELKKVSVDSLLEPRKTFASINNFSESIVKSIKESEEVAFRVKAKRALSTLSSRVNWALKTCNNIFQDAFHYLNEDKEKFLDMVLGKHSFNKSKYISSSEREILKSVFLLQ